MVRSDLTWAYPQPEKNAYQLERDHLIDAIRKDKPYNEARRGAEASLVTSRDQTGLRRRVRPGLARLGPPVS
jgi:hypothetical protein